MSVSLILVCEYIRQTNYCSSWNEVVFGTVTNIYYKNRSQTCIFLKYNNDKEEDVEEEEELCRVLSLRVAFPFG